MPNEIFLDDPGSQGVAAIFDMDGVLVDTVKLNWQAINTVLGPQGIHIDDDKIQRYLGKTLRDQVQQLGTDYGVSLDYEEIEVSTTRIKEELMSDLKPKEGVVELLESLSAQGIPIAVATSNTREVTEERLKSAGIRDFFDTIVTEDDVVEHKPSPAIYTKAAELMGITSTKCVVFEDAPSGVTAAKLAGMRCIAIQTSFVQPEDIGSADMLVGSLLKIDIPTIVKLAAQ